MPEASTPHPGQMQMRFDPQPRAVSVSDLVRAASRTLEGRFAGIAVEGEIAGFKRHSSGHLYFTLRDDDAQLPAVMWRSAALRLRAPVGDGMRVRCRGSLGIYAQQGKFQLYVDALEPAGAGAAQAALEELKRRLAAEGLFADERKRRLPFWPRRVGVVTSASGAAVRDVIRVIQGRAAVPILVAPAAVQGAEAPAQLLRALRAVAVQEGIDVVILGRGGGSAEDLSAFNDEALARGVAACPVPVIAAVGHEVDWTLVDYVADVRASTPSAAGERAVPVQAEIEEALVTYRRRLRYAAGRTLREGHAGLELLGRRLGDPRRMVGDARQRLEEQAERSARAASDRLARRRRELEALERRLVAQNPRARLQTRREQLRHLETRLVGSRPVLLDRRRHQLDSAARALHALSPLAVLDRGYALVRDPDGRLVAGTAGVAEGSSLSVTLRDGRLQVRVTAVHPRAAREETHEDT